MAELSAALADEGKLEALTEQALFWSAATAEKRAEIVAAISSRGELERLEHGLDAALQFHEHSAALFRDTLRQIEAGR
ncbi:MAG: hypothetical protein EOS36_20185 [Mesorhizobium sp.]|uniref:hypothetical protein n=1 Tax=Mesorhizobium sp. TaxID=1871066 RepID=UPI000FE9DD29|nr:hypothetical protein [Mesorhizobium sp.]RWD60678.1 MAG: hypothetical protein EOS36_20185 [Mesorhizobium sp.]